MSLPATTFVRLGLAAACVSSACVGAIDMSAEPPDAEFEPTAASPTRFGVMYFPPGRVADWATTGWQDPTVRAAFARDRVILAALGVRHVKLALEPAFAGLDFAPGAASVATGQLAAATAAVPEIVGLFAEAGMTTQLVFMTNSMMLRSGDTSFNDPSRPNDYEIAYGALGVPAGPQAMARDLWGWESAIVRSVLDRGLGGALDYVNVATEVSYSYRRAGGVSWGEVSPHMVQPLVALPAVPPGKRAADVLFTNEAWRLAADVAAAGTYLDVTEVHTYAGQSVAVNTDLERAVAEVRAALPGTRVVVGEFGAELCDNAGDEVAQAQAFVRALEQAERAGVDLFLNWGLWDYHEQGCPSSGHWGLGFSPDRPRNSMGRLVERQSALPGGNFEAGLAGFSAGGSGSPALVHGGPSRADAATNQRYLRLTAPAPGSMYTCSPPFALRGAHVAVSAYVRSTSRRLSLHVHYRDAAGWSFATGRAASIKTMTGPGDWAWRNVQSLLGGQVLDVPAGSLEAIVCFAMDADSAPAYLDLDALSVNAY